MAKSDVFDFLPFGVGINVFNKDPFTGVSRGAAGSNVGTVFYAVNGICVFFWQARYAAMQQLIAM
jgi:hypothetical protein